MKKLKIEYKVVFDNSDYDEIAEIMQLYGSVELVKAPTEIPGEFVVEDVDDLIEFSNMVERIRDCLRTSEVKVEIVDFDFEFEAR